MLERITWLANRQLGLEQPADCPVAGRSLERKHIAVRACRIVATWR
jgi:hypothetical protein